MASFTGLYFCYALSLRTNVLFIWLRLFACSCLSISLSFCLPDNTATTSTTATTAITATGSFILTPCLAADTASLVPSIAPVGSLSPRLVFVSSSWSFCGPVPSFACDCTRISECPNSPYSWYLSPFYFFFFSANTSRGPKNEGYTLSPLQRPVLSQLIPSYPFSFPSPFPLSSMHARTHALSHGLGWHHLCTLPQSYRDYGAGRSIDACQAWKRHSQ